MKSLSRLFVLTIALAWSSARASGLVDSTAQAAPPDRRALLEQALREPIRPITLRNVSLSDGIRIISEQTGVDIVMSPEVMALLPGGPRTPIQEVNIANVPLGKGLADFFAPIGMTFRVADQFVEIVPKPGIRCLGRAPTWAELDTVYRLSRLEPGSDPKALVQVESMMTFQPDMPNGWSALADGIRRIGAGPGDEVLTTACANLGWAWCPSEDRIVITSADIALRKKLQQRIALRSKGRALFEVLTEISRTADVPIRIQPGALAALPPNVQRNFWLDANDQSAELVLESISAYTGLSFLVEPDGVLIFHPGAKEGVAAESLRGPPRSAGNDPYIGKIIVPVSDQTTVEWFIRGSELPEDLRQMREEDLERAFEEIRRHRNGRASGN